MKGLRRARAAPRRQGGVAIITSMIIVAIVAIIATDLAWDTALDLSDAGEDVSTALIALSRQESFPRSQMLAQSLLTTFAAGEKTPAFSRKS